MMISLAHSFAVSKLLIFSQLHFVVSCTLILFDVQAKRHQLHSGSLNDI